MRFGHFRVQLQKSPKLCNSCIVLRLLFQGEAKIIVRLREFTVESDRPAILGNRSVKVAVRVLERKPQVVVGFNVGGLQTHRVAVGIESTFAIAQLFQQAAKIKVRRGICGFALEPSAVFRDCSRQVALTGEGLCQVDVLLQ